MHLHTHMHTHTNTHTHMHKYTHIHKRTLKYTLKYIHTNTHTAFSHAFMRTLRRAHMDAPEISLGSIKKWCRNHAPVQACLNGAVANVVFTSKLVDRFFALSDLFGITNPASPRFGIAI